MSHIIEIDPTVDYACKQVLGNPLLPEITIHFLNAVLTPESLITEVEILNSINEQKFESDKLSILDIRAIDQLGRIFNVEVQRTKTTGLSKRITYYSAGNFVDQLEQGDGYEQLRPSIGICILTVDLFPHFERPAYHNSFRMRTVDGFEFTDSLEIHTIELSKVTRAKDNWQVRGPLEQWIHFFLEAKGSTMEGLRERLVDPVFEKAIGVLEMIQKTPEQRRQYEDRLRAERDEKARLQAAIEEGEARGEARGKAEGKAEGKSEEKASTIRLLQGLLMQELASIADLQAQSLEELDRRIADLQLQLRNRIG
jgi:predicted transposase/invertase (TIGR01784 family)